MNDIPHHRDKRRWFYNEVTQAMLAALADGQTRMRIRQANRPQQAVLCPENMILPLIGDSLMATVCSIVIASAMVFLLVMFIHWVLLHIQVYNTRAKS